MKEAKNSRIIIKNTARTGCIQDNKICLTTLERISGVMSGNASSATFLSYQEKTKNCQSSFSGICLAKISEPYSQATPVPDCSGNAKDLLSQDCLHKSEQSGTITREIADSMISAYCGP